MRYIFAVALVVSVVLNIHKENIFSEVQRPTYLHPVIATRMNLPGSQSIQNPPNRTAPNHKTMTDLQIRIQRTRINIYKLANEIRGIRVPSIGDRSRAAEITTQNYIEKLARKMELQKSLAEDYLLASKMRLVGMEK